MSFTPLRRDCPICNGARKDCRQNPNGLIHCRDRYANPVGWHAVREDALGFMMWAEGDKKSSASSEEWKFRQLQQQIERKRWEEERRRGALPVPGRDAAIRKLYKYSGLAPAHRTNLQERGLTDEQIDKSAFFTIQSGERVPAGVPENLPGVQGGRFYGRKGYACPAFNPQGQIAGFQIRLDTPDDGGKYRWAGWAEKEGESGTSSNLPNGELPITYARPDGEIKRKAIGICEGILKPLVAAQKLGQIFIGASGFNFSKDGEVEGRPGKVAYEQLLEYLEAASSELGTKEVELFPDADVVRNPKVYPKYQLLCDLLTKLGYKVKIAWWGQFGKNAPDCDELPDNQEIKLISPATFADYAKRFGGADNEWLRKVREEWWRVRRFTPDIVTYDCFVNWQKPADGTIFFGRSGLGSGKTTLLKTWVDQWKAEGQRRFYVLGYRNTLLLQTAAQLNFMHIHDGDARMFMADEDTSFCLCVDSLLKIFEEDFEGSIIFLDEVMSLIQHLLHSPTIPAHKRDEILRRFERAIRSARIVVCMDGLMADWLVDYLAAIAPEKNVVKAQNIYKLRKPTINILAGTVDFDEKLKPNDRSPLLRLLLEDSPMPVICSDSQVFCEAVDELLLNEGVKTLRVDSKTIPEDYVKKFLENPNKYISENEVEALIYSPSAESGLDVSIKGHFTHQFCFFFGILGVDGILQMVGRIRDDDVQRFAWIKDWVAGSEQEHTKSPYAEKVGTNIAAIAQDLVTQFGASMSPQELQNEFKARAGEAFCQSRDMHFDASCQLAAIKNSERPNLRLFTIEGFIAEGWQVQHFTCSPDRDAKDKEKDTKEDVKRRNAADIFNAPLAEEEIKELAKSAIAFDSRWEERCRRIKAKLLDKYPAIQHSEVWDEDFIYLTKYQEPNFLERQELFWLFQNPDEALKEAERFLFRLVKREKTFIGNLKSRFLKVEAYRKLEIHRFLVPDVTWSNDGPDIQELLHRCKDPAIAKILGHPGKMKGIQNLTRLLKPLGIFLRLSEKTKSDRFYKIDTGEFFSPVRLAILSAIEIRHDQAKSEQTIINWNDVLQPALLSDESPLDEVPATAETTQNGGTSPLNAYTLYGEGATNSTEEFTESSGEEQVACDNSRFLEGLPGGFKKGDLVLTPQGKGEVLYFVDKNPKEYIVGFPDGINYFPPCELSPLPLGEGTSGDSSPLPSEKISDGPSQKKKKLPIIISEKKNRFAAAGAVAFLAAALASPAVASEKVILTTPVPAIAQEPAQETTAPPIPEFDPLDPDFSSFPDPNPQTFEAVRQCKAEVLKIQLGQIDSLDDYQKLFRDFNMEQIAWVLRNLCTDSERERLDAVRFPF